MCGLFGWSFKKKSNVDVGKREVLAGVLAVANSYRGDKSWGIYANGSKGDAFVRKEIGDIAKAPNISSFGRYPIVMAHTRQPTTGAVTKANAHPFAVGNIILAHNGCVNNCDELNTKYGRKVAVDSQHLAFHLNEGKSFEDIRGYGAITWIDIRHPRRVYVCRMRGGSMNVYGIRPHGVGGESVGVAWSSDRDHLRNAIGAARLDGSEYMFLKEGEVCFAEEGKFYVDENRPKLTLQEPEYIHSAHSGYYTYGDDDGDKGFWLLKKGEKDPVWTPRVIGGYVQINQDGSMEDRSFRAGAGFSNHYHQMYGSDSDGG